jgi:hypothetical protein
MKATIVALALLILSSIDISKADETEIKNLYEGETFELKCATNRQYPVVWYRYFQQTRRKQEILLGGEVSMAFQHMFILTGNQSLGEYNLLIPSADGRYVGHYECIDNEGLGSELRSIQINIIIASTSATDMAPIAELGMVASYLEAPKAAASSSENKLHSNSIIIPAVACGVVVFVGIVVTVIIVAIRKWRKKREGNSNSSCHVDVEARPPNNPNASETRSHTETSQGSVMEHEADDETDELGCLGPDKAKRPPYVTQSSRSPLLNDDEKRTPEIC